MAVIPTRDPNVLYATKPSWGLYAASFVARRRKSIRAIVTFRDLYEISRLAWQLVVAWTLPEAAFWSISRMLGRLNVAVHPARTRKEMASISALLEGTPMARCPQRVVVGNWSNRYEERLQYLRAWRPGDWNPQIDIVGIEHISAALNKGGGIVFWSAPFSFSWLVPKIAMSRLGLSVTSFSVPLHGISRTRFGVRYLNKVYRDIENRYLGERLVAEPEDFPIALQRIRDRLKLNGTVHFAVGGRGRRTETAKLLGGRLIIATGPMAMAHTMGAALLPVYVHRLATKRFEVTFGPPLEVPPDRDGNGDYAAAIQAYADALVPYVLRDPEQWSGWPLTEPRRPWRRKVGTRPNYKAGVHDRFEVISSSQAFKFLQSEWDDLSQRSNRHRFSQSFAWCWGNWTLEDSERRAVHCIVGRDRGRVVLIWPFVVKQSPLHSFVTHLGGEDPLVEDGPEADKWIESAWQFLRNSCGCDMINIRVRQGSGLQSLIEDNTVVKTIAKISNTCSVSWGDYENWESYYRAVLKKEKGDNERRLRRLGGVGKVAFEVIQGEQCIPAIDWTFAKKASQLKWPNFWRKHQSYKDLLVFLAPRGSSRGQVVTFVLKLDDRIVATLISHVDQVRVEALHTAYDDGYRRYAPGKILWGACLQWAFQRNLEFDMGSAKYQYKRRWANRESSTITYHVANSTSYALGLWWPALVPLNRICRVGIHRINRFCS